MSTNPINPEALREYADARRDAGAGSAAHMFLEACAFQWQALIAGPTATEEELEERTPRNGVWYREGFVNKLTSDLAAARAECDALKVKLAEAEKREKAADKECGEWIKLHDKVQVLYNEAEAEVERLTREGDLNVKVNRALNDALRTAAPAICATDLKAAAAECIGYATSRGVMLPFVVEEMLAILRKHTREVSVEDVAKAIRKVARWPFNSEDCARAAIAALGMKPAEPAPSLAGIGRERIAQTIWSTRYQHGSTSLGPADFDFAAADALLALAPGKAGEFVVDREKVVAAVKAAARDGRGPTGIADAAITEYERQRAEWEGAA
jgi:hypothetical protein